MRSERLQSILIPQTSFRMGTDGGVTERWLFTEANSTD